MLFYSSSIIILIFADRKLVNASPDNPDSVFEDWNIVRQVTWWLALSVNLCYWITHWIFAFKYWTLARKVEILKKGLDPNTLNRKYEIILYLGIIFNFVGAVFFQLSLSKTIDPKYKLILSLIALFFTAPLHVSWIVLADAFRRFKST